MQGETPRDCSNFFLFIPAATLSHSLQPHGNSARDWCFGRETVPSCRTVNPHLTLMLCPQSVDHVPEVPLELVNLCSEQLEEEPSKELFKESTK